MWTINHNHCATWSSIMVTLANLFDLKLITSGESQPIPRINGAFLHPQIEVLEQHEASTCFLQLRNWSQAIRSQPDFWKCCSSIVSRLTNVLLHSKVDCNPCRACAVQLSNYRWTALFIIARIHCWHLLPSFWASKLLTAARCCLLCFPPLKLLPSLGTPDIFLHPVHTKRESEVELIQIWHVFNGQGSVVTSEAGLLTWIQNLAYWQHLYNVCAWLNHPTNKAAPRGRLYKHL